MANSIAASWLVVLPLPTPRFSSSKQPRHQRGGLLLGKRTVVKIERGAIQLRAGGPIVCDSTGTVPLPSGPKPEWGEVLGRLNGSQAPPSLSEIVWPSLGGFVAMAAMGSLDVLLAPGGLSFTLGSFGGVCALLFAAPRSPASQKYNVFVSHLGCAAVGVLALAVFGPGLFARSVALAAAIAFMQYTGSLHPPAAGLPLIMIDVQKLHHLQWWYVLFPGFVGCVFLFLLQGAVLFLKENCKF